MSNMPELETRHVRGYGWVPDLPDPRDMKRTVSRRSAPAAKSDLRPGMPEVWDQGHLGSCTGHGIAACLAYDRIRQGLENWKPSPLFIYYIERTIERTIDSDAGAMIRDGMKAVASVGACREQTWPYDITKFRQAPPMSAYDEAAQHEAVLYESVAQTHDDICSVLSDGFPVVFGFSVFESLESPAVAQTGTVPMPSPTEQMLGGHCVVLSGHDDDDRLYLCRNSWGPDWGQGGYFTLPYEYVQSSDLADDFWTVTLVA